MISERFREGCSALGECGRWPSRASVSPRWLLMNLCVVARLQPRVEKLLAAQVVFRPRLQKENKRVLLFLNQGLPSYTASCTAYSSLLLPQNW